MLDENLPTYLLKTSKEKKQNSTFLYSQYGNDFEPAYTLKHLDPEQQASRNRYAVALYDAFNPDVLYAEVLLIPEWTSPTLSQDEIRRNGGVTPAPAPILPLEFTIQLYNPDQQVLVKHKPASFSSAATWEFEMPSQSFRTPSHSKLDRSQSDPAISEFTPKLALKWKKDGRLSKDLACYLSGRSLNPDGSKNKNKEPDITIAILKNLKEVTIYEPNMTRVEVEDLKGFEITLLLGSVVIRDVYFNTMKETFNLSTRKGSTSNPSTPAPILPSRVASGDRIPPTDPRTQWELDQETQRLKRQAEKEAREVKRREEAEQRQIKQMLEAEEREQRRRQAEVDAETERLKRLYGSQNMPVVRPPQQWSGPQSHGGPNNVYMSGAASQSTLLQPDPRLKQKSSIFGFRRHSDQEGGKLNKKKSAMW